MNDNDRAALVERLSKRINDVVKLSVRNNSYIAGVMAAEFDRLLTERRETTVPDDRVERAAKAIHRRGPASGQDFRYRPETEQEMYRDMARAALTAAGPEADWLDAALDSVHPETYVSYVHQWNSAEGKYRACIRWPRKDAKNWNGYPHHDAIGTGDGPTAAIKDAIATALAAKQEGDER